MLLKLLEAPVFCHVCVLLSAMRRSICDSYTVCVQGSFSVVVEAWHDDTGDGPSPGNQSWRFSFIFFVICRPTCLSLRYFSLKLVLYGENAKILCLQSLRQRLGWLRAAVVERWSLTSELSLSCARPAADGWPLMWVNRPLFHCKSANQAFRPFGVDKWIVDCNYMSATSVWGGAIWWTLTR